VNSQRDVPAIDAHEECVLALREELSEHDEPGTPIRGAVVLELGESHYVRTEQSWREAGEPSAKVQIAVTPTALVVDVHARTGALVTNVPDEDDRLDNELPDINADGLQWYLARADAPTPASGALHAAELIVPAVLEANSHGHTWESLVTQDSARRHQLIPGGLTPAVSTVLTFDGWAMRLRFDRKSLPLNADGALLFDLVVNERPPERERRRGQLVLSGGRGFGYIQGWRRETNRFVRLVLPREAAK
jgi:hypothetical protein